MMLAESPLTSHLRTLSLLVVHLLLTDICRGQLIGASQPIIATLGDDIILPCCLEPAEDLTDMTLEWSRPDLEPRFVHVWRSGVELEDNQHKAFKRRTTLFTEELQHGNISLRLNRVKLSDNGTYSCYIPTLEKQTNIQLVVGAVSSPVISLSGIDGHTGRVVLQCESAGWYPEPEMLWLDSEGNLLFAGPTETIGGPDDLYTVSSRVTVEKKHGNNFTCRVQQNNINQSRDDLIHVPNDFFLIPFSSAVPIIDGLSISLAFCIMFILASGFFLWRRNETKIKRTLDKTENEEERNCFQPEAEMLMSHEDVEMQNLGKKHVKNQHLEDNRAAGSKSSWFPLQLQAKQQKRKTADKEVELLRKQLDDLSAKVQMLTDEKKKSEDERQQLLKDIETKDKQMVEMKQKAAEDVETKTEEKNQLQESQTTASKSWFSWPSSRPNRALQAEQQKREKAEKEVESLKQQLKINGDEANQRWKAANETQKKLEGLLKQRDAEISQLKRELEKQIWEEKQNAEKFEKEQNELLTKNAEWQRKLQEETTQREKAEKEVETLKKQLKTKLDGSKCEDVAHQMESRQQSSSSSDHHSLLRDIILDEIHSQGEYVRLKNTSTEDKLLGGCKLELHINNRELVVYTFDQSFTVQAGGIITLWRADCYRHPTTGDLLWTDLKPLTPGDPLQFILFSQDGAFKQLNFS